MESNHRYIIWDFDGTLAYRNGKWAGALLSVLKDYDPLTEITEEQIQPYLQSGFPWHAPEISHVGLNAEAWWLDMQIVFARAFRNVGVQSEQARQLARNVRSTYLDFSAWQCFNDALTTVNELSHHNWQHIMLSNHVPELPALLDYLNLTPHFQVILNSAQTGWEKPNVHAFRLAQDWIQSHTKPATSPTTWVIGDNISSDIRGAQEAGLPAILVHGEAPGILCSLTLAGVMRFLM